MSRDTASGTLGLQVLHSWLSHRTKILKGKKFSPDQNKILPARWTQTNEPLLLSSMIEHTIKVTPQAAGLLNEIVNNPLNPPASDLPTPTNIKLSRL